MQKERTTEEKVIMEELLLPSHPSQAHSPCPQEEVELLKEQEEQGCNTGKGRAAAEGAQAQAGAGSSPEGHSTSAGRAGQGW